MTPEEKIALLEERLNRLEKYDRYLFEKDVYLQDGRNIVASAITGSSYGNSTSKLSVYGATPVVRAGAISSPAADVNSLKTAVDAIITAIKNIGITA